MLCALWDQRGALYSDPLNLATVFMANAMNNNWPDWTVLWAKTPQISTKTTQTDFPAWQGIGTLNVGESRFGCILVLGITCSYYLLKRLGTEWLLLIFIHAVGTFGATLLFFLTCKIMVGWLIQSQTRIFFTWHLQTDRKVRTFYRKRRRFLWGLNLVPNFSK